LFLSQTSRYALRALVYLADEDGDGPVRVEVIAEDLGVPRNYLSKILHALAKSGVLTSLRGPRGGFRLARPAEDVRLVDVVSEFDSVEALGTCLLGRPQCVDSDPCAAHEGWKVVRNQVEEFLRDTTLAQLRHSAPPL
jgi:Rrf2 family transcriptional regulator, iron-sulfur cluster assembly transcription factor